MANRNQAAVNLQNRKALKAIGAPVNSKFGAPGNMRKHSPKVYKNLNQSNNK